MDVHMQEEGFLYILAIQSYFREQTRSVPSHCAKVPGHAYGAMTCSCGYTRPTVPLLMQPYLLHYLMVCD